MVPCSDRELKTVLLPHPAASRIDAVHAVGPGVRIEARTGTDPVECPGCGIASHRVHSRYDRWLADTALAGREVLIRLRVRRLFCDNRDCTRKTFAEQVSGLTVRHARHTTILQRVRRAVGLALGGRAGARLTGQLAASVSRMTLLRQIRALPDPDRPTPRVLGVDDFALRRGHDYGTILIDIESRRPVDVLDDRRAESLTAWLRTHPGVEIVCRDRAGAYAEGASAGAPDALQVADGWHLWHNLAGAVERTVAWHRAALPAAHGIDANHDDDEQQHRDDQRPVGPIAPPLPQQRTDRTAVRTRKRYNDIHALLAEGESLRGIGKRLGLARGTVRRFAHADTVEELLVNNGTGYRPGLLDEFKPYLHQRFSEGCTNATVLFGEITARGYRGSDKILRKYLHPFRTAAPVRQPPRHPPSPRRVVAWIMRNPTTIDANDQRRLDAILAASPPLAALVGHVRAFATIMCELRGRELERWMAAVEADDQPALHSFVRGLRRDQDAVTTDAVSPRTASAPTSTGPPQRPGSTTSPRTNCPPAFRV
ncbi:ISL3 family transposase [Nocardia sp. NPDC059246]|uniref:ISL3 family transposase n=1 Tax=unclassified Nocardia TaxID=2637762 RepID=UPI0036B0892A